MHSILVANTPHNGVSQIAPTPHSQTVASSLGQLVLIIYFPTLARRAEAQSASVDVDETDFNENLELPGADLSNEELTVRVLPKQEDEFTCSRCFLVQHRSRLAATKGDQLYCRDCAA